MNDDARRLAERALEDGERLLWCGRGTRPWHQWVLLAALIAFALPLRLASATSARHPETDAAAVVFVHRNQAWLWLGFAVVAVWLFVELRKSAPGYAVTNRRLLILGKKGRAYPLHRAGAAAVTERADGSGDLTFPELGFLVGFYRIEGVRDAARAVDLAVASSPPAAPRRPPLGK